MSGTYTTQLQAGLGIIDETRVLLDLWHEGMDGPGLYHKALESGRFPSMSARRLDNVVTEAFAPRYLISPNPPAVLLKTLMAIISNREFEQLLLVYTCRAHPILADYVREVYWSAYASGRDLLSNRDAHEFVSRAVRDGRTTTSWADGTVDRVAGYLTRCLGDFGLLEGGIRRARRILPYRLEPRVGVILAYDLHFSGHGDNQIVGHPDWELFGLARDDVVDELKRLALRGHFIVQSAGGVMRIAWPHKSMEELVHVLAHE